MKTYTLPEIQHVIENAYITSYKNTSISFSVPVPSVESTIHANEGEIVYLSTIHSQEYICIIKEITDYVKVYCVYSIPSNIVGTMSTIVCKTKDVKDCRPATKNEIALLNTKLRLTGSIHNFDEFFLKAEHFNYQEALSNLKTILDKIWNNKVDAILCAYSSRLIEHASIEKCFIAFQICMEKLRNTNDASNHNLFKQFHNLFEDHLKKFYPEKIELEPIIYSPGK